MNRSEVARRKVLDAGVELLHDAGIPAFTVEAVSKRSGVAKTTIYRHWPNGTQLLVDTVGCIIEPVPTPNSGSLAGDLHALYSTILPTSADEIDDKRRMMFGLLQAAAGDPDLQASLEQFFRERTGPVRTILQLAQARGDVSSDLDLDRAVDMIEGPILFRFLIRRVPVTHGELAEVIAAIVDGLARRSVPHDARR